MDETSSEGSITIKQMFGHVSNEESLKIADAIDDELLSFFIKEVVQESDLNVILIERKGLNLFHPYLQNIEGLRSIISIKPLCYHHSIELKYKFFTTLNFRNSNILLTDAITTGSEARKILKKSALTLKFFGGFKKVCGYLALKSALDELQQEFPDITFKFLKVVDSRDVYDQEHKKINYVYQKRMEPIDEEHPFIIVEIKPEISLEEIKRIVIGIVNNKINNNFVIRENELGIDTKNNFTIYFNEPNNILDSVLKIHLQEDEKIEKLAIRFKFSSPDPKIRIMVLSMPHLNKETRFQWCKRFFYSSCNRNVPGKLCKIHIIYKMLVKTDRCALCAECIDRNVSNLLLKDVYSAMSESGLMKVS